MSDSDHSPNAPIRVDPYVVAMLACERVIKEEGGGAETLVSVFSEIITARLPTTKPMAIYVKLTDAEGPYIFRVDYVHLPTERILAQVDYAADLMVDRLEYYQLVFAFPKVTMDEAGFYEFRLFANGGYLARIAFSVRLAAESED